MRYRRIFASGATGICLLIVAWLAALSFASTYVLAGTPQPPSSNAPGVSPQRALLNRYCVTCHNEKLKTAGLMLDRLDVSNVGADAAVWEKAVRKLSAGLMPPAGRPRPDKATDDGFRSWLETELDRAAAASPNPGRTEPFHRLNRFEYQNAIRDLLALDVDVASLLPGDDASYGFDNIAGVLKMSPMLIERYLSAAQKVSRLAVGTPPLFASIDSIRLADDLRQEDQLEGLPFGTRGGALMSYTFPMDAEYVIRVRLARDLNEDIPAFTEPQELEVSVDGERAKIFTLPAAPPRQVGGQPQEGEPQNRQNLDADWEVRLPVEAGRRDITVTFLNRTAAMVEEARLPFLRPYPGELTSAYLRSIEIAGPFDPTGPGDTPSRRRIFVCRPSSRDDEATCARTILSTLARRAYRRPVTDQDLEPLLTFYDEGRSEGGFDTGIERALRRLLVSPEFLYRIARDPAGVAPHAPYRVSDLELASRLSFFLWSSIPDDELLDLAERRRLSDPIVLEQQVRRMLADVRAEALVKNFAGQWLFLRNLPSTGPILTAFPDYDDSLRQALRRETELFVDSILRGDRSVLDLLAADYTFINERLARHYGIPNVKGSHFRRVTLSEDRHRGGLLGHGSVLTVTSYPGRTSPVLRGKWVLENLLGTPPPPPPPNVPDLKPTDAKGAVLSMRERMVQHRANAVCAACHSMMDPPGLALENFDAVGKWRMLGESFDPIDDSGVLPDGTTFEGLAGLRQALLDRSDVFVTTLTEKLLTYALGRGLEHYDMPAVRAIVREGARHDHRASSLILGIVNSVPFQMRRSE